MLLIKFPGQLAWWLRGAVPLPYRPRLRLLLAIPKQRQRWWRLILPPVRFRYRWHSRIYLHLSRQFWSAMSQAEIKVALTQTFSTLILPELNALTPTTSYFNLPEKLLASLDSHHDFLSDSTSAIEPTTTISAVNPTTNQKVLATTLTDFTRKPTHPNNSLNFSSSPTTVTAADLPLSQLKSAHKLKRLISLTPTTDTSLARLTSPYLDQQFTNKLATTDSFDQVPLISENLSSSVNNIDYTETKSAITTSIVPPLHLEYTIPGHHSKPVDPSSSSNSIKSLLVNSVVPTNSIEEPIPPNNSPSQSQLVSEAKPPITSASIIDTSPTKLIDPYLNQQVVNKLTTKDSAVSQIPLALKNLGLPVSNISHIEAKPVVKISATNFTADQKTVTSMLTDYPGKPIYPDNPLNSFSPPANISAAFVSPNSSLISSQSAGGLKQLLGLTALVSPRWVSQPIQELATENTFITQPSPISELTWPKVVRSPISEMSHSPSQHQELITSLTVHTDEQLPLVAGQLQLQLRSLTTRSNTVPTKFSLNFPSNYFPYPRLERRQSTTLTGLTEQSSLPTKPRSNPEEFFVPPPELPQIHSNGYHRQAQIQLAENFWERHYFHRIHWHLFIR